MVRYTSFAVFLFSAIALVIPSGFSLGPILLLLGSVVLLKKTARPDLTKEDDWIVTALALYFIVNLANNLLHHAALAEYDAPLRFLLVIPGLLLLLAYPAMDTAIWSGVSAGGISAGLYSIWQLRSSGLESRPGGYTHPIQYGNISLLLAIFCLCGLAWALGQRRSLYWIALLLAGAVFGILGSLITGSRGSWIALPFCIVILYRHHAGDRYKRAMRTGLLALVTVLGVAYAVPQSGIHARTALAVHETQAYFMSGDANTSVGQRLEMWRTGIAMVPGNVWMGTGKLGYMQRKIALISEGLTTPIMAEHTHLHNDYLDALVKHGVTGLLALLTLYLVPLALFRRHLKDDNPEVRRYALAGVLLIVSYLVFGLTQAFLTHINGVMVLTFMLAIFWTSLRSHQRQAA